MNKIKASLHTPIGVRDIYGRQCADKNRIQHILHRVLRSYGFSDIQTPTFEFFDVFGKEKGTVSSRQMFKFFDRDNNTLVLRPDITPSIARCVAKYYKDEDLQIRMCYSGNTFVNVPPYKGKLEEVTQVGAELFNDGTSDADGEMISLAADCLIKAGLKDFQIEAGHAGFLRGLFREAGFDDEVRDEIKSLLQSKNFFGVEEILDNIEIDPGLKEIFLKLPDLAEDFEAAADLVTKYSHSADVLAAVDRLRKVSSIIKKYGFDSHVTIDLSMLGSYDYYTGVIFKAYTYGNGEALLSGGRYDGLVEQFGKKCPAIGLAITVDELCAAMERQGLFSEEAEESFDIILYKSSKLDRAIAMADEMRSSGKNVRLIRKSSGSGIDEYQKYAKKAGAGKLIYLN